MLMSAYALGVAKSDHRRDDRDAQGLPRAESAPGQTRQANQVHPWCHGAESRQHGAGDSRYQVREFRNRARIAPVRIVLLAHHAHTRVLMMNLVPYVSGIRLHFARFIKNLKQAGMHVVVVMLWGNPSSWRFVSCNRCDASTARFGAQLFAIQSEVQR